MKAVFPVMLLLLASAWTHAEETHTKEPLSEIKKAVDAGKALIVDVREQDEWNEGHVKGAAFLPLSAVNKLKSVPDNLPKDKTLYVHCAVGVRSLKAARILKSLGLDARAMTQNVDDFEKSGFAIEKK